MAGALVAVAALIEPLTFSGCAVAQMDRFCDCVGVGLKEQRTISNEFLVYKNRSKNAEGGPASRGKTMTWGLEMLSSLRL